MSQSMLSIENLSAGFNNHRVLSDVSVELRSAGIHCLMGPAGVGKSTLLRTLARWNEALPSFWTEGEITLDGSPLLRDTPLEEAQRLAPLLSQTASLFTATVMENAIYGMRGDSKLKHAEMEELAHKALAPLEMWDEYREHLDEPVLSLSIGMQRALVIARLTAGGARVLLADEPFRDISAAGVHRMERILNIFARDRAVLMISHSQQIAREIATSISLITAGKLVEHAPTETFFTEPKTELAKAFLETGNCWPTSPTALESPPAEEEPPDESTPSAVPPLGFHWVLPGLLGGMQKPGLLRERDDDLRGVQALGCKVLVTLTEEELEPAHLEPYGLSNIHFPIVDMRAPSDERAAELCTRLESLVESGTPVAVHCKAGLGRTGTMLASFLVWQGLSAVDAIHRVRSVNPYYIQSQEQLQFISGFATFASNRDLGE